MGSVRAGSGNFSSVDSGLQLAVKKRARRLCMARMLKILGLTLLASPIIGCVPQEKYNALKLDHDAIAQRLASAENDEGALQAQNNTLKDELAAMGNSGENKAALTTNLMQQNQELQKQIDELNAKYEAAIARQATAAPLPPELSDALQSFANDNPDLVEFDSARGTVKFKSDVTFSPGSAEVTPQAATAITRFAGILNSPAAAAFELMVVGHTDNKPVSNPATLRAGHKDNWYLSVHRAISVSDILRRDAVSPARLEVAGFADERPIASNDTEAGRSQNRRVEVLILPTKVTTAAVAPAPADSATPASHVIHHAEVKKETDNKQ
jgi:chemotaxis protein MotB